MLITTVIIAALIALALLSRKSVYTELLIPSTEDRVWSVLMNEAGYEDWNPVLVPLNGELTLGATVRYLWKQPSGDIEINSKVVDLVENQRLHQRGGTPGVLTFDHTYTLTPQDSGVLVTQSEVYRGIGVWFWDAKQMKPAYQSVNEALAKRVIELRDSDSHNP